MTLVTIPGEHLLTSLNTAMGNVAGGQAMNAAGESVGLIGRVRLADPSGGSKTLSAAGGGAIAWPCFAVTFADGSTTFRVGLQDVDGTSGVEDGTFDVFGELTGGGGGIVTGLNLTAMTSGTKTVAHGDLLAIVLEMPTRGGADSVSAAVINGPSPILGSGTLFPYGSVDTGGGVGKSAVVTGATIVFDDGTLGWIPGRAGTHAWWTTASDIDFASDSTPDEYAAIFSVPYATAIDAVGIGLSDVDTGNTLEIIVYSDPLGTPVAQRTLTIDPDVVRTNAAGSTVWPYYVTFAPLTLTAGASYGVAVRPTNTTTLQWRYFELGSGLGVVKQVSGLSTLIMAARTDQTGAFVETDTNHLPILYLNLSALDDGTGTGGSGETAWVFG